MHRVVLSVLLLAVLLSAGCHPVTEVTREEHAVTQRYPIIPMPQTLTPREGAFLLKPSTRFVVPPGERGARRVAEFFLDAVGSSFAVRPQLVYGVQVDSDAVLFELDSSAHGVQGREAYRLEISPTVVRITAAAPAGLFYGVQSLLQLLPPGIYSPYPTMHKTLSIPCVAIEDAPRFSWRGVHLDVSRHFFPKSFIKRYIDLLAMYKMNVFHWHLTDDNGWRIEIKKYPRLTSVGAWRVDRENDPWSHRALQRPGEEATYGGYYTQEDVKEIVAYAAARFITVLPEIEMPAHSVEALAAYPEFSCTGGPFTVLPGGYWPNANIFCAGNDSTFVFLDHILDEVATLFPSPYIHIGGDEADKANWKKCPKCQARIKAEGLQNEEELQSYFIKRIEKHLHAIGKRLIGWDEILQGGLAPDATVMSWRGIQGGIDAAKQGHDVVMTPTGYCYFDYYQSGSGEPLAGGGFLPLDTVYAYEPIPPGLTAAEQRHVLGAQANLWTEYIPTPIHAEYMLLPRMLALSEVVWTDPARKNYQDFLDRLLNQYQRFDAMGVSYRDYRKKEHSDETH
jgi:hexosaminidase